jgi:hypothetical protein
VLPYQWTTPFTSSNQEPAPTYHWFAPIQFIFRLVPSIEPMRTWQRDSMLYALVLAVLLSALVYPMDWGKDYQTWPLPTLYAVAAMFAGLQVIEIVGAMMAQRQHVKTD